MIPSETLWLSMAGGVLCLGLATYLHKRKAIPESTLNKQTPEAPMHRPETQTHAPVEEGIRQMGLIQKDEFDAFYQPIIEQVRNYTRTLTGNDLDVDYFESAFKALRKRRSTIFEFGSSEADQGKRAAWTYGLFASLSIRHIASLLSRYHFHSRRQTIAPTLLTLEQLALLDKQPSDQTKAPHRPDTLNVHLIDKVLPANMIQTLADNGIYPSLVNAVTGYYFQPLNPFYRILEDVERYVKGAKAIDEETVFMQTLSVVLDAIASNLFSKNKADSPIFEGQSYLLIDRCILWEIFRSYSVAETAPLGKAAFEVTLSKQLGIHNQLTSIINYTVHVVGSDNEPVTIELRNMLALPYQKIPMYTATKPKRIGRAVVTRDVLVGDREVDTPVNAPEPQAEPTAPHQPPSREGSQQKVTRASKEEAVVVGDLFSPN